MWKFSVGTLWVCNYRIFIFYLLILSRIQLDQCQIIRKSIELQVKDYLTPPKSEDEWGKDKIYAQRDNSDSVKRFEDFPPHTPASALVFSGVLNQPISRISTTQATGLNREMGNNVVDKSVQMLLLPTMQNLRPGEILMPTTDSSPSLKYTPSTQLLEEGLNEIQQGYSFSFTNPSSSDGFDSQGRVQGGYITFSTPLPAMVDNNDPILGYFSKYIQSNGGKLMNSPTTKINENKNFNQPIQQSNDQNQQLYSLPQVSPMQSPNGNLQTFENQGAASYESYAHLDVRNRDPGYSETNDKNSSPNKSRHQSRRKPQKGATEGKSSERVDISYTQAIFKPQEADRPQNEYRDAANNVYPPSGGAKVVNKNPNNDQKLPTVPPTIGVIGWKSNKESDSNTFKPNANLMNMANQFIRDDLKIGPNKQAVNDTNQEEEEEEEDGEEGEEESGEEEDGEEEEEEEEEDGEEGEVDEEKIEEQYKKDYYDEYKKPPPPPQHGSSPDYSDRPAYSGSQYENSEEYSNRPSLPPNSESQYQSSAEYSNRPPPPPRYEHSGEYNSRPPQPASYESSGEYTNRPPPRDYDSSEQSPRPPPRDYDGSGEYVKAPPLRDYESSAEYQNGPPPQNYKHSGASTPQYSEEYSSTPHAPYYNSAENPPPHYTKSQEYSDGAPPNHSSRDVPPKQAYSYSFRSPSNHGEPKDLGNKEVSSGTHSARHNEIPKVFSQITPSSTIQPEYLSESLEKQQYKKEVGTYRSNDEEDEPLPPGPPYLPPPNQDPSSFGYVPPPSFAMGVKPSESFEDGVRQTWTPITVAPITQNSEESKANQKYKSENGRWLLNGGPILENTFSKENHFNLPKWNRFGNQKPKRVADEDSNNKKRKGHKGKKRDKLHQNLTESDYIESKDLPVEHRDSRDSIEGQSSKERESSELHEEVPSGLIRRPPVGEEENRVSEHEFARKVPTRLGYPGGGLWAKPKPGSGIQLGFVPKKVYTQTRKYNTVKHLPREAALADASTPEEVVNAPRLREVVSHKKTQEVYEEEGYEDAGYDHGGYKKKGQSESDSVRHDSAEHVFPETPELTEEEAFEEHLAQLEAIPESEQEDPSSQSTANKQIVEPSTKPKVKVSWKQQKTTTDERSMAFLDEKGTGGILTHKRPPKTEGVSGKYENLHGDKPAQVHGISERERDLHHHQGGVSFQRYNPTRHLQKPDAVIFAKNVNMNLPAQAHNYDEQVDYLKPQLGDDETHNHPQSGTNTEARHRFRTSNSQNQDGNFKLNEHHIVPEQKESDVYMSKNNRYTPPRAFGAFPTKSYNESSSYQRYKEYTNDSPVKTKGYSDQQKSPRSGTRKEGHYLTFPEELNKSLTSNIRSSSPKQTSFEIDYSPKRTYYNSKVVHPPLTSLEDADSTIYPSDYDYDSPSKERKSRDLTSLGLDDTTEDAISQSEFHRPSAAVRLLEEQLSPVSSENTERRSRSRQPSRGSNSSGGRKYKEITRNPSQHSEEEKDDRKNRALQVKVDEDEVNVRHPFLPRDSKGENIDYVKLRMEYDATTVPIKDRVRDEYDLVPEVTEKPRTTTTPRTTTMMTTPSTTTEYVPEDPAETLKRLRHNPFLSSIFPPSEEAEEVPVLPEPTSTTPKITTYRAKPATDAPKLVESAEDAFERLKSNPYLSTILTVPEKKAVETQSHPRRGSRKRPIIVVPEMPKSSDRDVKHVEQLTLAQYAGPSHGLMYTTIPRRTQQRMTTLADQLNTEGVGKLHIVVKRNAPSESKPSEEKDISEETEDEEPVDDKKYPFYNSPASVVFPLYSPMRYALNPKDIPVKTEGGMEFYESRDKSVICEEPTPPKDIVPKRNEDGEWNKNPQPNKQRMGKLGDQIDCLKARYFGTDPLDNPFFKETKVEVPNFKPKSGTDIFGFQSDIKENIQSLPNKSGENFLDKRTKDSFVGFSENIPKSKVVDVKSRGNKTVQLKPPKNYKNIGKEGRKSAKSVDIMFNDKNVTSTKNVGSNHMNSNQTNSPTGKQLLKPTGFRYPDEIHEPKKVLISIKSQGTSNHPKIKLKEYNDTPYNTNVKILPRGKLGYLMSHPTLHINNYPKNLRTFSGTKSYPTVISSSTGLKSILLNKKTGNIALITQHPDEKILKKFSKTNPKHFLDTSSKYVTNNKFYDWWNSPLIDNGERKYIPRVKRSDENDKYINSKESIELKNFLLQKYAHLLAKESSESTKGSSAQSSEINDNQSTTSRAQGGVNARNRHPYSSRYSAPDPMDESPSTEVKINNEKKENTPQENIQSSKFSPRKPKLRFPKLSINTRPTNERERVKFLNIPEVVQVKSITTTTTTTPPPPSTTTRMYKPRVVYKKEYGKPLDKVVNMFAILKQRPNTNDEDQTAFTPTEKIQEGTPTQRVGVKKGQKPFRNFKPQRLEQFEHRTITKEEVFKKTYAPEDYAKERSDIVEVYDKRFDHPDLRGPISRMSRNSPDNYPQQPPELVPAPMIYPHTPSQYPPVSTDYRDMLVYMVDPLTGVGEWKVMPVALTSVSKVDTKSQKLLQDPAVAQQALLQSSTISKQRKRNKTKHNQDVRVPAPQTTTGAVETTDDATREMEYTTEAYRKSRSKTRRKPLNNRNKANLRGGSLRNATPTMETSSLYSGATDESSLQNSSAEEEVPTTSQSKVIMEPHKRKYFYAKVY